MNNEIYEEELDMSELLAIVEAEEKKKEAEWENMPMMPSMTELVIENLKNKYEPIMRRKRYYL